MIKRVLKVKFCQSEEELNDFIKDLPLEEYENGKSISRLHRITYLPKPNGKGTNDTVEIATSIISIVEYWDFEV